MIEDTAINETVDIDNIIHELSIIEKEYAVINETVDIDNIVHELSIIEKDLMDTILDLEDAIKYTNHHVMIDNFKVQKERTEKRLNAISYAKGVILGWYKL